MLSAGGVGRRPGNRALPHRGEKALALEGDIIDWDEDEVIRAIAESTVVVAVSSVPPGVSCPQEYCVCGFSP